MKKFLLLFLLTFMLIPTKAEAKIKYIDIKELSPHDAITYFTENKEDKMILCMDGTTFEWLNKARRKYFKKWLDDFKNDKDNKYGIYPVDYFHSSVRYVQYAYMNEVIERALKDRYKFYEGDDYDSDNRLLRRLQNHYFNNVKKTVNFEYDGKVNTELHHGLSSYFKEDIEKAFDDYMNTIAKDFKSQSDAVKVEVVFNYYDLKASYNMKKAWGKSTCTIKRLAKGKLVEGVCHDFTILSQELCGYLSSDIDAKYLHYQGKANHANALLSVKNNKGENEYYIVDCGEIRENNLFFAFYKYLPNRDKKAIKKAKKYIEDDKQISEFESELVNRVLTNLDKEKYIEDYNIDILRYVDYTFSSNLYNNKIVTVTWTLTNNNKEKYGFDNLSGQVEQKISNYVEEEEEYEDYEEEEDSEGEWLRSVFDFIDTKE